ncbi:MAG: CDP-alcohol phosphatidyltransferase family protein [Gemmatimonadota bacterium]
MLDSLPSLEAAIGSVSRPVVRFLHLKLGLSPSQLTWSSLGFSIGAAIAVGAGHLQAGLILILVGQIADHLDGSVAREFHLASPEGARLDTLVDRLSEAAVFIGFLVAGLAPAKVIVLAFVAIMLLTSIAERSRFDPGFKRWMLYFGLWVPYPILFSVIFVANLAGFVIGLLILDIKFQNRMDALGGDLDTIASRAATAETAERVPRTEPA